MAISSDYAYKLPHIMYLREYELLLSICKFNYSELGKYKSSQKSYFLKIIFQGKKLTHIVYSYTIKRQKCNLIKMKVLLEKFNATLNDSRYAVYSVYLLLKIILGKVYFLPEVPVPVYQCPPLSLVQFSQVIYLIVSDIFYEEN